MALTRFAYYLGVQREVVAPPFTFDCQNSYRGDQPLVCAVFVVMVYSSLEISPSQVLTLICLWAASKVLKMSGFQFSTRPDSPIKGALVTM